jgi:hypothetical protein
MSPRRSKRRSARVLALGLFGLGFVGSVGVGGCYHGFDVEDKQPPPGHAGGSCVLDDCYQPYACISAEQVCYDPLDPCKGIYCSGHGTCVFDMGANLPVCSCDVGYSNDPYAYFCTPIGL